MAERVKSFMCADCVHWQKENPIASGSMVCYQCSSQGRDGRVVGWCLVGKKPKGMGCGEWNRIYVGDMIRYKKRNYIYCGVVKRPSPHPSHGKARLLYCAKAKEYMVVLDKWYRIQKEELKQDISIVMQTKEQIKFHRKVARKLRKRWEDEKKEE